jgi:hypothetical protein
MGSRCRSGTSLVEVILVVLLLSLVVPVGWALLARQRNAGSGLRTRAEALETLRTLDWILREELAGSLEGRDWIGRGTDSLALRAFRGHAFIDTVQSAPGTLMVCFRGIRAPEPEKDSVLVLGSDGRWRAHDLVARLSGSSPRCDGEVAGGRSEGWVLSPSQPGGVLARLFESGSYHLVDRALRYRRGLGGRQPLTPESLVDGRFLDSGTGGGPLEWEVHLRPAPRSGASAAWTEAGIWRGGGW